MQTRTSGDRYVRARNLETLPDELRLALDEVTINETPRLVGSSAFLNHRYPSDIDVFERVNVGLGREAALSFLADQFRNIMQKVIVDPELHYSDFKAGEDYRFDIPVERTSVYDRIAIVERLKRENLLTASEAERMMNLVQNVDEFKEQIRQRRVIRWTPQEVIRGRKDLPNNSYVLFREALGQPATVKLDVIVWSGGRFQSVEVLYQLNYFQDGRFVAFFPMGSYIKNLLDSIEQYSSPSKYNPLKVAKRLWSLSLVIDCQDLLKAIDPILSSDAAAVNQVNSDVELLIDFMQEPLRGKDINKAFLEMLGWHKRLTNHMSYERYALVDTILDRFYVVWLKWTQTSKLDRPQLKALLERLSALLKTEVIQTTEKFFETLRQLNVTCGNPRFISDQETRSVPLTSPYL
mgnify:FL=1